MDILIHNRGSMFGFQPTSDVGRTWIDENLQTEGWQWLGRTLYVDHRYADDILDGMVNDGLTIG
jgi:hypothetical protein